MKKHALPMLVAAAMALVVAPVAEAQQEKQQTPKQYQECLQKAGNNPQQQTICEEGLTLFQAGQKEEAAKTWEQVLKPAQK